MLGRECWSGNHTAALLGFSVAAGERWGADRWRWRGEGGGEEEEDEGGRDVVESYGDESRVVAADDALECGRGVIWRGGSGHFGDVCGRVGAGGDVEKHRMNKRTKGREGRERERKRQSYGRGNGGAVGSCGFWILDLNTCEEWVLYTKTPTLSHMTKH